MVQCVVIFSLSVHQLNNFLVNQLSHFSIDCHKQGKMAEVCTDDLPNRYENNDNKMPEQNGLTM